MNKIPVKLGPLALLLTIISICLTTMSILTFTTASADYRMADRYSKAVSTRYALEKEGNRFIQTADNRLSSGKSISSIKGVKKAKGNVYKKSFKKDGYRLNISLKVSGRNYTITNWKIEKIWDSQKKIKGLWTGN